MNLVHLFNLKGRVSAPIDLGKGLAGTRRIYGLEGGEFEGERLRGRVLPGGGEWFLQGEGSLGQPDVRLLLETDDAVPIYVHYTGFLDFNETVLAKLGEGKSTEFGDTQFLTHVRFETGHPKYEWLARTLAVGEGRMHPDCVEYAIYEVTHGE